MWKEESYQSELLLASLRFIIDKRNVVNDAYSIDHLSTHRGQHKYLKNQL